IIVNLPGRSLADAKDYYPDTVQEYLGIRPDQVIDYKALMGDSSDNIPGVFGIGKKTAQTLLAQYETLEGVYAHIGELKPGIRKKLETDKDNAFLSQKLATIVTDLSVPIDLEMARPDHFDPARVHDMFKQLEFRSLLPRLNGLEQKYGKIRQSQPGKQLSLFGESSRIDGSSSLSAVVDDLKVHIVDTSEALEKLTKRLKAATMIAFDTETTSTDQMKAELVGISLAVEPHSAYYIPVGHTHGEQLPLHQVLDALRDPLTDTGIPKAGHNLKYDFVMLNRYGLRVNPLSFDTMIAEWLANPDSRNLGLKNLSWVRIGHQMTEIEELIGKGKKQISMADVPIEEVAPYAGDDAAIVLQLIPKLEEELDTANLTSLFDGIEMPLVQVLAEMEMTGIGLDTTFLEEMSKTLSIRLSEIENRVIEYVGESFNLNSTQQLSHALFDVLNLPPPDRARKTASGYYSTAAGVLESMQKLHPVVDLVLEYRELSKLRSTYVDALPQQINHNTGRVHTSFNQTGSRTGRLASSDPNLQNIPIRTELGRSVRKAFVAAPGCELVAIDYSQVELRIAAHMAQDEGMLAAFRSGQDIHATTAAAILGVPLKDVTREQRRHAKAINFGLIYGMSAFGLTNTTDLTLAEAEDFVDEYFRKFPGIKSYLDGVREQAAKRGYVETLLGRRRYFPGLQTPSNQFVRNREEREAINAPIQGTAADIMKIAMLHVSKALADHMFSSKILLQVHDEIVLECPTEELVDVVKLVKNNMEGAYPLDVPLKTEARSGKNWGVLKPVE
ncbi:MAG: DNA polymerase I, partial [Anaerolineales bacterium]